MNTTQTCAKLLNLESALEYAEIYAGEQKIGRGCKGSKIKQSPRGKLRVKRASMSSHRVEDIRMRDYVFMPER